MFTVRLGLTTITSSVKPPPLNGLSVMPAFAISAWGRLFTTYTGPILRVRRSIDQAELDIGARSDNKLDTGAILAHCGAGDGFVTRVYDQSGFGRHPVQATATLQPIICQAGVLQSPFLFAGRFLRWLGTDFNSGSGAITAHFMIKKPTAVGGFNVVMDGGTSYSAAGGYSNLKPALMRARTVANDVLDGKNISVMAVSDGSTAQPPLYVNGVLATAELHNSNFFTGGVTVGAAGNNTASVNAGFYEQFIWKAQLGAADRAKIFAHEQNNIGGF